ncbi:MAG: GTP cyclohydrolase I FolE [Candidatus Bipolaricaulota bacterium]|nr:GTP cyclohydrolase I FolE [Candidatus Bipolaricaulota bacterium]MDW8141598.1 GTP cyclohydrolase I FolE [Candidatus Bipolaricaulota bacterium]
MKELREIEKFVHRLLTYVGEDSQRLGLRETPKRYAEMITQLTAGYRQDPKELLRDAIFPVRYDQMIVVRDIAFYSLCEHHIIPFFGKAHVGYIPDGRVIGMSKIPQIVEHFSRKLQLQERMGEEIADFLMSVLKPKGVGVVLEGFHLCMAMRDLQKDAKLVTSAVKGIFRSDPRTRAEFLQLIG